MREVDYETLTFKQLGILWLLGIVFAGFYYLTSGVMLFGIISCIFFIAGLFCFFTPLGCLFYDWMHENKEAGIYFIEGILFLFIMIVGGIIALLFV